MTTRHNISRAAEHYRGAAQGPGDPHKGVMISALRLVELTPVAASANGIVAGATASDSVVTTVHPTNPRLDVARIVTVTGSGAGVNSVVKVTGLDGHGAALAEEITANGAATVAGKKAFSYVDPIVIGVSGVAGTVDIGWGDVFGYEYAVRTLRDVMFTRADGVDEAFSTNPAVAPQTATSGDNKGTFAPTTAADGSVNFSYLINVPDTSQEGALGAPQYIG